MAKLLRCVRAALVVWAVWVTTSCGSVPRTNYYALRLPSPPAPSDPKTSFVVGVERFRAIESLRDDRIVYYESPTQLNYYEYHRWTADPATMLAELAARHLGAMGVFAQVRLLPARDSVDYVLKGRVLSFEEVDYEGGVRARVALDMALLRAFDQKVVWSLTRTSERPVQQRGVSAVVDALNSAAAEVIEGALPNLVARVEEEFRAASTPAPSSERKSE